jgi:hypothetical protein
MASRYGPAIPRAAEWVVIFSFGDGGGQAGGRVRLCTAEANRPAMHLSRP